MKYVPGPGTPIAMKSGISNARDRMAAATVHYPQLALPLPSSSTVPVTLFAVML